MRSSRISRRARCLRAFRCWAARASRRPKISSQRSKLATVSAPSRFSHAPLTATGCVLRLTGGPDRPMRRPVLPRRQAVRSAARSVTPDAEPCLTRQDHVPTARRQFRLHSAPLAQRAGETEGVSQATRTPSIEKNSRHLMFSPRVRPSFVSHIPLQGACERGSLACAPIARRPHFACGRSFPAKGRRAG